MVRAPSIPPRSTHQVRPPPISPRLLGARRDVRLLGGGGAMRCVAIGAVTDIVAI